MKRPRHYAAAASRPLKVYRYSAPRGSYYVAARTKKAAREALGVNAGEFEKFASVCDPDALGAVTVRENVVYVKDPVFVRELKPGERVR